MVGGFQSQVPQLGFAGVFIGVKIQTARIETTMIRNFALGVLLIFHAQAQAINCRIASSPNEQAICKSRPLLALDAHLNALYRSVKERAQSNKRMEDEQRNWIKLERDVCANDACLQLAYQKRIDDLKIALTPWCQKQKAKIAGTWIRVGDAGPFDAFSAGPNHEFDSWLHQRPEIIGGTWTLDACNFTVQSGTGMTFDMVLLDMRGTELRFYEYSVPGISRYKAIVNR